MSAISNYSKYCACAYRAVLKNHISTQTGKNRDLPLNIMAIQISRQENNNKKMLKFNIHLTEEVSIKSLYPTIQDIELSIYILCVIHTSQ